jgi:glycosidase
MKKQVHLIGILILITLFACKHPKQQDITINNTDNTMDKALPQWTKDKMIYEVNVRQYSEAGTFEAIKNDLPRLKEMGVDILWFMPINPVGLKNRKGSLGSYYSIQNYTGVNPEFGTLEEFIAIVNEAHKLGMYVLIDWVANHTAWDHVWTNTHPEFYSKDSSGNIISPVEDWSDVADLNYDNKDLWQAMINEMKYWLNEADIDGFRCDVAMMVPTEFWNEARKQLNDIKPVFMLAEAEQADLMEFAFDACYSWELMHTLNDIAKGNKPATAIDSVLAWENNTFDKSVYHMRFTTNHDENSWNGTVFDRLGDGAQTFSILCYTLPGIPLIYSGQEAAMNKALAFFDKDLIPWENYKFQDFYGTLNKLKHNNPALWNGIYGGEFIRLHSNSDSDKLYAFARTKESNKIVTIINLSGSEVKTDIEIPEILKGKYKNYFTNESIEINEILQIDLHAWDYWVLIKE